MTPERLAEIEAEAKNPKKFGWSNPEGTLLELAAHIRDLEAQVREARVAFCEFHDMARNMARYLSTDGICHWIASEEFGATTPPSPEVK